MPGYKQEEDVDVPFGSCWRACLLACRGRELVWPGMREIPRERGVGWPLPPPALVRASPPSHPPPPCVHYDLSTRRLARLRLARRCVFLRLCTHSGTERLTSLQKSLPTPRHPLLLSTELKEDGDENWAGGFASSILLIYE